jgi:hypothetical protein
MVRMEGGERMKNDGEKKSGNRRWRKVKMLW